MTDPDLEELKTCGGERKIAMIFLRVLVFVRFVKKNAFCIF